MRKKESSGAQINNPLLRKSLERNPFSVPEDYFLKLKEEITLKKRISELGESSFIVPPTYQKTVRQDILLKIRENELRALFPIKKPAIPSAYFEDLQKRILNKTTRVDVDASENYRSHQNRKQVIQGKTSPNLGIRKLIPYMAAASITIAVAFFAILDGVKLPNGRDLDYFAQVEEIPTEEIITYLAHYTEAGDLQYLSEQLQDRSTNITDQIPSQEIEAYLEYGL